MKLYYITRVNIPSGAAQSVQISSMCEAFSKEDIDFKLISTINKENINLHKNFIWDKIKLNSKFKYFEFALKTFKKVRQEKPTHVFTRDIAVVFLISFLNIKVAYEAHKEPRTKTASIMLKILRNKTNFFLVTISKALKDYYTKEYNYKENQVLDYHDCVFVEKYDMYRDIQKENLRKKLSLHSDKIIIMHTGSLYPGRGAEHFETIMKNFKDILFIQVGGTKEDIEKYKKHYDRYVNIKFVSHQSNETLIQYQMSSDLLFYPMTKVTDTYWCCSPMKVFEFMATGIPILSSNVGSVTELLNETNSIPFNPEDEQSIISGVNLFLKNKNETIKRANKALEDVREKYTWDKRAYHILEFIK